MARRRRPQEEHNRERWLVSYADFITLLFAFFVVMYSISSVNEGKYKVLSESMLGIFSAPQRSLEPIQVGAQETVPLPVVESLDLSAAQGGDLSNAPAGTPLDQMSEQLGRRLAELISDGLVTIHQTADWVELSLSDRLLFPSGGAVPNDEALILVDEIAAILSPYPNAVMVEGFTDNVPISTSLYPSNWELSTARAAAVVRLLIMNGISPDRLVAIGYGEHRPVASNDTAEGRQRNRRVVLRIAKDSAVRFGG